MIDRATYLRAVANAEKLAVESDLLRAADKAMQERRNDWRRARERLAEHAVKLANDPVARASLASRISLRIDIRDNERQMQEVDARLAVLQEEIDKASGRVSSAIRRSNAARDLLDTLVTELQESESAADREELRSDSARKGER